jgi:uncharacterized protein (DUF488 family)
MSDVEPIEPSSDGMEVLTFGHGTADAGGIIDLLRAAGVTRLVDVRTAPGSRRNPEVARSAMEQWLPDAGIGYRWDKRLGGWRKAGPDSPDTALENRSFRGYAEHMRTSEFAAGIGDLVADAAADRTAVMCAETVWWRCHRKLIADFLVLVHGVDVRHVLHDGTLPEHRPSPEARLVRNEPRLIYDAGQAHLDV